MGKAHAGFTQVLIVPFGILADGTVHPGWHPRITGRGAAVCGTITNLTRGQVITPPMVIVHNGYFRHFVTGEPAIPELATLAEDRDRATGPAGATGYHQTGREVGMRWKS